MPLTIETRVADHVTIITLAGPLVSDTCQGLRDKLARLLAGGKRTFVLNLKGITSIDDCGVGTMIGIRMKMHESAGSVKLVRPGQCLHEAFAKAHFIGYLTLEDFFEVYSNDKDAVASFNQKPK